MTTKTNEENLRQYKSTFSLIVDTVLAFSLSINLVREENNLCPDFK